MTATDWKRIVLGTEILNFDNLNFVTLNNDKNKFEQIFCLLKTQSIDLVVIDDINGLCLQENHKQEFMYRLNDIIKQTDSTVIIVSNIERPNKRNNKRPELTDFKTDEMYRLCDIVAFTYIPECDYWSDDYLEQKHILEIIISKSRKTNMVGMTNLKFINNSTNLVEVINEEKLPNY